MTSRCPYISHHIEQDISNVPRDREEVTTWRSIATRNPDGTIKEENQLGGRATALLSCRLDAFRDG